jgi:hypothetical protein
VEVFSGLVGTLGLASLVYGLLILNQLSRKLGAVTKMPPFFRGYYLAGVLVGLALLTRLVRTSLLSKPLEDSAQLAWLNSPLVDLLGYHLALALAMTISLAVTWRYWSWLLREP